MQAPRPHYEHVQAPLRAQPHTWRVTGVAGLIGSHRLHTSLHLNQRVVDHDNFSTSHHSNLDDVRPLLTPTLWARFNFIKGDTRDLPDCLRTCLDEDVVAHQAAPGSSQHNEANPIACTDARVSGFMNVRVAARESRVTSFTYAASNAVCGEHPDLPQSEHHTGHPLSVFGAGKLSNEQYAQVFARQYDLARTGPRCFDGFGLRQDPNGADAALMPHWIGASRRSASVDTPGDGETRQDLCCIANAVQANRLVGMPAEAPAPRTTALAAADTARRASRSTAFDHAQSLVYNAGVGERVGPHTLFALLRAHLSADGVNPSAQPIHQDNPAGGCSHNQADMRQAHEHLVHAPTHNRVQGLIETLPALPGSGHRPPKRIQPNRTRHTAAQWPRTHTQLPQRPLTTCSPYRPAVDETDALTTAQSPSPTLQEPHAMEHWIDDLRKTSVTKAELSAQLSEHMGVTVKESRELVDGFFEILLTELRQGKTVKLAKFGTFQVRTKAARPGRNLRTSEQVEVNARRSVAFSTGPKLRSQLQPNTMSAQPSTERHSAQARIEHSRQTHTCQTSD